MSEMLLRVNEDVFHKHRFFKDKHVTRPQTVKLHRVHPHVPFKRESLGLLFWRKRHVLPAKCYFCELRNPLTVGESGVRGQGNVGYYM